MAHVAHLFKNQFKVIAVGSGLFWIYLCDYIMFLQFLKLIQGSAFDRKKLRSI